MELQEILSDIEKKGYKKIGIQTPDGIKQVAVEIADRLKEMGKIPVITAPSTFGACDLSDEKVMKLGCECLIHVGHSKFYVGGKAIEGDIPVYYYVYGFNWPIIPVLEKNIRKIPEKKLGLLTTAQHMHKVNEMKEFFEKHDKVVNLGEIGNRTRKKTQILGCDSSTAQKIIDEVDALVYVGSGYFHPIKALDSGKKMYKIDPLEGSITILDKKIREDELKKELLKVAKYSDEKKWGILVSTKKGQHFPEMAEIVREKLESLGKEAYFFIGDRIFESDLIGFGLKIYVNTACPRLPPDFRAVAVVNPWALKALEEIDPD